MNDRTRGLSAGRVLITGASGFIGSSLVEYLRPLGCEVHGVSRKPRGSSPGIARWWQVDTSAMDDVRRIFAEVRPEIVFDLASHVAGGRDQSFRPP